VRISLRTDERLIIAGANGTGKTTFVRKAALPMLPQHHTVIILDPKRDRIWKDIPDVSHNWLTRSFDIPEGETRAFRWPKEADKLANHPHFRALLRAIWKQRNVLIISDETNTLFPGHYTITPEASRLNREGRQRNIGFWWLMQRPSDIPIQILSEAESWVVFTLRNRNDRRKAADYIGDPVEALPPQKGRRSHVFWFSRPGMNKPMLYTLTLRQKREEAA
jgi:energy-coupling factor transporter ATP-binding protein EcfA2